MPINAFLFTIDIDSLYTNINTEMGLWAVSNIFRRYPDAARPDVEVLKLLEICLVNNDFQFENKVYLQMEGPKICSFIREHLYERMGERGAGQVPFTASILFAFLG